MMRMPPGLILIALLLFSAVTYGQNKKVIAKPISFQQLQDSMQKKPKAIVVNLSTTWCLYCKLQDKQIEKSDTLQKILQRHFYYVQMNAEAGEPIVFNGREYSGSKNGLSAGVHELAETLGKENGQLSYPAIVVLDKNYKIIFRSQGFIDSRKLLKILLAISRMNE